MNVHYKITDREVSLFCYPDSPITKNVVVSWLKNPPKFVAVDPKGFCQEVASIIDFSVSHTELQDLVWGRVPEVYDLCGFVRKDGEFVEWSDILLSVLDDSFTGDELELNAVRFTKVKLKNDNHLLATYTTGGKDYVVNIEIVETELGFCYARIF